MGWGIIAMGQGIGSFVAILPAQVQFRIEPGQAALLVDALHIMELRTGVGTEAAGLATELATNHNGRLSMRRWL